MLHAAALVLQAGHTATLTCTTWQNQSKDPRKNPSKAKAGVVFDE